MTSPAQRTMLFGLWKQACAILGGRGLARAEADLAREALTVRALGEPRSWGALGNADVDAVKAELLAIVHPGDFHAQVEQLQGGRKRRIFALEELLQRLGKPREYADAVARRMNREGRIGSADLDDVDFAGFDKVLAALRTQAMRAKRKAKPAAPAGAEEVEEPF